MYHVMEYLDSDRKIQGYVFLEDVEFRKWEHNPKGQVKGYAVVIGMESMAEWGMIACNRLWDFKRECNEIPSDLTNISEKVDNLRGDCELPATTCDANDIDSFYEEHLADNEDAKRLVKYAKAIDGELGLGSELIVNAARCFYMDAFRKTIKSGKGKPFEVSAAVAAVIKLSGEGKANILKSPVDEDVKICAIMLKAALCWMNRKEEPAWMIMTLSKMLGRNPHEMYDEICNARGMGEGTLYGEE